MAEVFQFWDYFREEETRTIHRRAEPATIIFLPVVRIERYPDEDDSEKRSVTHAEV